MLLTIRLKWLALETEKCSTTTDNGFVNVVLASFTFMACTVVDIEVNLEVTGVAAGTQKVGDS